MKIIHTSDWHLGARLHEEDRTEEHRVFLDWLAELMRAEKPDALIVSGDVFDVKAPSPQAQSLYYGFLARVVKERLCSKVVVTAGNHDNAKLLAAPSSLLAELGVSVVSVVGEDTNVRAELVPVKDEKGEVGLVVGTIPFVFDADLANIGQGVVGAEASREEKVRAGWKKHCSEVIAAAKELAPDKPIVLTGHCTLRDALPSDNESERCRQIGGLEAFDPEPLADADYVALGHLHMPQAVKGYEKKMFYSGAPLRMSFDEARGKKDVNVVTLTVPGESPTVERREVPEVVPILTISGTPEEAKCQLGELVAADAGKKRFVRIRLEKFEGEAKGHWVELRELVKGTGALILEENDARPIRREATGLRAFAGRGIRQLDPRTVAEQKLKGSNRHFSEDEIVQYLKMYDEIAGGVA